MSIAVCFAILATTLRYSLVVGIAAFEFDRDASVETSSTSPSSYRLLCASDPWNSPCTGEFSKSQNATAFVAVASSWNNRLFIELAMLSMDSHASFCPNKDEQVERSNRDFARTVFGMLTSLHLMQHVRETLTNATQTAIEHCEQRSRTYGRDFFLSWKALVLYDLHLRREYIPTDSPGSETPQSAGNTTFVVVGDDYSHLCVYTVFREALVNQVFMNEAFNHRCRCQDTSDEDHRRHMLARAMLELARKTKDSYERSLLNQIYKETLLEVALEMTCENTESEVKERLFGILRRHLAGEFRLSSSLDSVLFRLEVADAMLENGGPAVFKKEETSEQQSQESVE